MRPAGFFLVLVYSYTQLKEEKTYKSLTYRLGTVNSKSFVGKVLLQIKWKFELTVYFKHGMLGKL